MKQVARMLFVTAIGSAFWGCQPSNTTTLPGGTVNSAPDVKASHVVIRDTPFYTDSPAQPMPANGIFEAGTGVSILKRMGNFTLVQSIGGTRAYVATRDIESIAK